MITRREFMAASAGLTAGILSGAAHAHAEDTAPLIVDTHQHLWDRSILKLPWLESAPEILQKNYRLQEYGEATQGLNIRAVYMEVDVAEGQHDAEADYVTKICQTRKDATVAAVIGGRPADADFADYLERHAEPGIVQGVRRVLHGETPKGHCLKPEFVAGIRVLGAKNLSFDLCMRPEELDDGVKLAELCPDTRFIVDHCGNANPNAFVAKAGDKTPPSHDVDAWKRSMEGLAARPNTICKISGVVAHAPKGWDAGLLAPPVNFCLDAFGADRVVFGSDWPVCLLGAPLMEWVTALREIVAERPAEEQAKLWSGNALRFYNLSIA